MSYLEVQNAAYLPSELLEAASRHYWPQLVQQIHVLVLGLNILGNPYSCIGDFSRGLKQYYEPCQVTLPSSLVFPTMILLGDPI